jgi:hypothetical protein
VGQIRSFATPWRGKMLEGHVHFEILADNTCAAA